MIKISNFQFAETSSHVFSLVIGSIGGTGNNELYTTSTYGNIDILTDRTIGNIKPFHYGTKLAEHLEFPMTIVNKHGQFYESWEVQIIQNWLFGRKKPHYLTILDPDKTNESYECWLINPEIIKVDNKPVGWSFVVRCTSPYSVTNNKTTKIEMTSETTVFNFWNHSDVEDYLYPKMNIKLADDTSSIQIINQNDNNRMFSLFGLRKGEEINVDNEMGIIEAKSGDKIIKNFNLNFFRLVEGLNILHIEGKGEITITTRFTKAVGGV